jgi:hypothetical protein
MMRQCEQYFLFEVARCVIHSLALLIYLLTVGAVRLLQNSKEQQAQLRCAQ